MNFRTLQTKAIHLNAYHYDSNRRENRAPSRGNVPVSSLEITEACTPSLRFQNRVSLILDEEFKLGPDYDFLKNPVSGSLDQLADPLAIFDDFLDEMIVFEDSSDDIMPLNSQMNIDNELFNLLYVPDDINYGVSLFGNLRLEFNWANPDQNREQLANTPILTENRSFSNIDVSQNNRETAKKRGSMVSIQCSNSDLLEVSQADKSLIANSKIGLSLHHIGMGAQDSPKTDLPAIKNSRYVFTRSQDQLSCLDTEFIGRKRNLQ